jgi:hypothetical protein
MNNDFEFDSLVKNMAMEHQPELPSPGVIWWRAQILKKQAEAERIERPAKIMRAFAVIISLVVVAGLWSSELDGTHGLFTRVELFPLGLLAIVGAGIGIGFIGIALRSMARFKNHG